MALDALKKTDLEHVDFLSSKTTLGNLRLIMEMTNLFSYFLSQTQWHRRGGGGISICSDLSTPALKKRKTKEPIHSRKDLFYS